MTASPFDWKPLAGRTLQAALNRALALDPATLDALRLLDGQRVAGVRLVVGPVDDDGEPHLSVRSTLSALVAQLPMFRRDDAPPVGRLRVSGDAELARRLQRLAEQFDPDWQRPFAAVFGDVMGVQIANTMAGALRQAR